MSLLLQQLRFPQQWILRSTLTFPKGNPFFCFLQALPTNHQSVQTLLRPPQRRPAELHSGTSTSCSAQQRQSGQRFWRVGSEGKWIQSGQFITSPYPDLRHFGGITLLFAPFWGDLGGLVFYKLPRFHRPLWAAARSEKLDGFEKLFWKSLP